MATDQTAVIVEGEVTFAPKVVEHNHQSRVLSTDVRAREFDDGEVMPRLTSLPNSTAEH